MKLYVLLVYNLLCELMKKKVGSLDGI